VSANTTESKTRNRLLLFAAAFLFSTGGAAIKACSLEAWQIAGFRAGIAAVTLSALMPEARCRWKLRTWLIGASYAATLILFALANKLTTSANTIFLQSTAPLYLLLLGPFVLHEAIHRIDILVISAVATGACLLLLGSQAIAATAPHPAQGNLLAAGSGITWALTLTGLRWAGKHSTGADSPATIVVAGNCIAFAACFPFALPMGHVRARDAVILLYLGVFQIGVAYFALSRSIRYVPGLEAATLLLVEPVFNPIWSWLIQDERPSGLALLGGCVIILATIAGTWWRTWKEQRENLKTIPRTVG
jgi:drug/metabolite transporter (DMT)-like permease